MATPRNLSALYAEARLRKALPFSYAPSSSSSSSPASSASCANDKMWIIHARRNLLRNSPVAQSYYWKARKYAARQAAIVDDDSPGACSEDSASYACYFNKDV